MMRSILAATTLVFALPTLAPAQTRLVWEQIRGTFLPPLPRERHDMAFDAKRGYTVLFGGRNDTQFYDDTWLYDGSGWRRMAPAHSPAARADHAMAYDPVRERVVLIGGSDGSDLNDIWEWDGQDWTRVAQNLRNVGSWGAACYDPIQGGVFYNSGGVNRLWDGRTWRSVLVQSPVGATRHKMVFHAASGGPVTVNGQYLRGFDQTGGWKDLYTTFVFSLTSAALAIDPAKGRLLMQGGSGRVGSSSGELNHYTWEWGGTRWIEVAPNRTLGRTRHAMVFDSKREVFVMFGGSAGGRRTRNDTWELREQTHRASYATFGQGCAGSTSFRPTIGPDLRYSGVPVVGGTFFLRGTGMPAAQPTILAFGTSATSWSGLPLPFGLAPLGAPGCQLLMAPELLLTGVRTDAYGAAGWRLAIPNDPRFLGAWFYNQCMVIAPGANPGGMLWSNAGRGTIGWR